ncbi:pollen-specific leucine-rich repeat extensin-like protein 2 [Penaeus japonicus]|uniref:pollen-specific leucine-rich repeat extensin-like protein 2 n=1 Tax=Penaeus japonicus TaxID=27405 RepID=UPI001C715D35|nr:pollen-specific leucine-rich repeat extensin-like protein 2 [Penaeus japonicus]
MIVLALIAMAGVCVGAPQGAFNIAVPNVPSGLYDLPNAFGASSGGSTSSSQGIRGGATQLNPLPPPPAEISSPSVPAPPPVPTAPPTTTTHAPPMPYQFSYNIMDGISTVYSSRTEEQLEDGPLVGSYSYLRPDGVYMTVMYTADENGYRAEVKESLEAPLDLQTVEDNRAKYEVSLPGAETYLVDVTDEELREYILQAAAFESSQVQATTPPPQTQSQSQTLTQSQTNFQSQTSTQTQPQPQGLGSGSSSSSSTSSQTSSSNTNLSPPVRGVQPPSGYSYPQPSVPFTYAQP